MCVLQTNYFNCDLIIRPLLHLEHSQITEHNCFIPLQFRSCICPQYWPFSFRQSLKLLEDTWEEDEMKESQDGQKCRYAVSTYIRKFNFQMFSLQNVEPTSLEGHDSRLSVQNVYVTVNSGRPAAQQAGPIQGLVFTLLPTLQLWKHTVEKSQTRAYTGLGFH